MTMPRRYIVARSFGREELADAVREDTELLSVFGLKLLSVEGGVRAAVVSDLQGDIINPWDVVTIENKVWQWLRPILVQRAKKLTNP
jgi:hypothetical protein